MLPAFLLTVITPSATVHCAGDLSFTLSHSFWFFPSNRTIASDGGGVGTSGPGVTTLGTGSQTSVSSGLGFVCADADKADRISTPHMRSRECELFIRHVHRTRIET